MLLSGTPSVSCPADLFPQVSALAPKTFPSWEAFVDRYCGGVDMNGNAFGSSNLQERHVPYPALVPVCTLLYVEEVY